MNVATYPNTEHEASPDWTKVCNWACLSLRSAPSTAVEGVSVTVDLDGMAPADVWAKARETAQRYGLSSSAVVHGDTLTLRFTRPEAV